MTKNEESIITDLQTCGNLFFRDKEGKYFGYPTGESTTLSNLDEREFSVQGLGNALMAHDDSDYGGVGQANAARLALKALEESITISFSTFGLTIPADEDGNNTNQV